MTSMTPMTPLAALEKAAPIRPGGEADAVGVTGGAGEAAGGVVPSWVATPATVADAAELMRIAAEHGLSVVPRGAGTRLHWGAPPASCDLLIDTTGLDRVIEHAAGDLVVRVEAGLPMRRLAEVLAAEGQRLALDVPLADSTVGGTLATAAWGPLRLRYGAARDLLIGITIVRADGGVAKAGGKVVKNVAGYDLGKLFAGSYGTLGLIVEAAFRLHPLPAARSYVTRRAADFAQAWRQVGAVLRSPVVPSAIEVDAVAGGPVTVTVLVEGIAAGVTARAGAVAELLGGAAVTAAEPPEWWGRYPDGETLVEVTTPPAALPDVAAAALPALAPLEARIRGSAGSGHWYVGLPGGVPAERAAALVAALRTAAAADGGSAIVRTAPASLRERVDLWGPAPSVALMRRIKDQFDPGHRLAPGRFVGGI
jgi:glycolate oxidase FAD binding subunit